jgi:hypothetical protein
MAEVGLRESPREVATVAAGSARAVHPGLPERRSALAAAALVVGLSAGTAAQGGYHGPGRVLVAASLAVAVVLHPWQRELLRTWPTAPAAALAGLAAFAVGRGLAAGDVVAGVGWAASAVSVAAVLMLVAALPEVTRRTVLDALLIMSVLVAASAWAGLVWHVDRLASAQDGVWRGLARSELVFFDGVTLHLSEQFIIVNVACIVIFDKSQFVVRNYESPRIIRQNAAIFRHYHTQHT